MVLVGGREGQVLALKRQCHAQCSCVDHSCVSWEAMCKEVRRSHPRLQRSCSCPLPCACTGATACATIMQSITQNHAVLLADSPDQDAGICKCHLLACIKVPAIFGRKLLQNSFCLEMVGWPASSKCVPEDAAAVAHAESWPGANTATRIITDLLLLRKRSTTARE